MMRRHQLLLSMVVPALLAACTHSQPAMPENTGKHSDAETNEIIKKQFIKANQQQMQKENDEMDYYARSHNMPFVYMP